MSCGTLVNDAGLNTARNISRSHSFAFLAIVLCLSAMKGSMIVVISEGKTVSLVLHRLQFFLD